MKILDVTLHKLVRWRINQEDPPVVKIDAHSEFGVVNPLVFYRLLCTSPESATNCSYSLFIVDADVVVVANTIGLVVPDDYDIETHTMDSFDLIASFMRSLREASGQADISTAWRYPFHSFGILEVDKLPDFRLPKIEDAKDIAMINGHYAWGSAITRADIDLALSLVESEEHSAPHSLFLDALEGYLENDYYKCILYSAFALETVAKSCIEKAYQAIRDEDRFSSNFRIRSFAQSDGSEIFVDPVYKSLSTSRSLRNWLHEIPLYISSKSMMLDDKVLYDKALNLYEARSRFAHSGKHQSEQNEFQPTLDGALKALECMHNVFRWFGEGHRYVIPQLKPLMCKSMKLTPY